MLKFIRKYQVLLLAVGGTLLMIVFLLQPILGQLQGLQLAQKIATVGPTAEKVSRKDRQDAQFDIAVIEAVLPNSMRFLDQDEPVAHWFLLKREAERAGLIGHQSEASFLIERVASEFGQQFFQNERRLNPAAFRNPDGTPFTPGQLNDALTASIESVRTQLERNRTQAAAQNRVPETLIDERLSLLAGVRRLDRLFATSVRIPEPEIRARASEDLEKAIADFVVVPASAFTEELAEATDEDLAAFFDEYNDNPPGDTDANPFGLGYVLPPRIKLEWLEVDRDDMRGLVSVTRVEVARADEAQNPGAEDFGEEAQARRALVREALINDAIEEAFAIADDTVRAAYIGALRDAREVDGIYTLPDGWTPPTLEEIAARVTERLDADTKVRGYVPAIVRLDDWQTQPDLSFVAGSSIGFSQFQLGARTLRFGGIISQLDELRPDDLEDSDPTNPRLMPAQIGIPLFDPPAATERARFYVTVTEAAPESAPPSFDEIRDQVTTDERTLRAYERLTSQLPGWAGLAEGEGLEALAEVIDIPEGTAPGAIQLEPTRDASVRRLFVQQTDFNNPFDRRVSNSQTFTGAVLDAADELDPSLGAEAGTVFVSVELPAERAVAIAAIRAFRPATNDEYLQTANALSGRYINQSLGEILTQSPFGYQELAERHQYVPVE